MAKHRSSKYEVVCKYSQNSHKYISSLSHEPSQTPLTIVQSIQIRVLNGKKIDRIYEIRTSNRNSHTNMITLTDSQKITTLKQETFDWQVFEYILKELEYKIDKFSSDFIKIAVNIIKTNKRLHETPKCIVNLREFLDAKQEKNNIISK
ncbi:MAG: hypothetical protein ACLRFE_03460 [Clostridia bacterium]